MKSGPRQSRKLGYLLRPPERVVRFLQIEKRLALLTPRGPGAHRRHRREAALADAVYDCRPNQVTNLREGSRGSGASKHQLKISRILVASEIALSLALLIGAGLLLRSFWHLIEVRPGFDPHHVVTEKIWLPVPNDPAEDNYQKAHGSDYVRGDFWIVGRRRDGGVFCSGSESNARGPASSAPARVSAAAPTSIGTRRFKSAVALHLEIVCERNQFLGCRIE